MAHFDQRVRQKQVIMALVVNGVSDWHQILPGEFDFSHAGLGKFNVDEGLAFMADFNGTTPEGTLVGQLVISHRCEIVELEVECSNHPEWGKMVYIKDHPSYRKPPKDDFEAHFNMHLYRAMFQTEKASEQHFCLYSTAINGKLHKSLVYRKVVLNSPKPKDEHSRATAG